MCAWLTLDQVRINTAVIAGLGVVALWASAFPAIRIAAPDLGVIGLSFVRLAGPCPRAVDTGFVVTQLRAA